MKETPRLHPLRPKKMPVVSRTPLQVALPRKIHRVVTNGKLLLWCRIILIGIHVGTLPPTHLGDIGFCHPFYNVFRVFIMAIGSFIFNVLVFHILSVQQCSVTCCKWQNFGYLVAPGFFYCPLCEFLLHFPEVPLKLLEASSCPDRLGPFEMLEAG
ncbi:hypothetical protein B0T13DRAFT_144167 [Neurospora crassa]|nr:hypothetical protein B0T13DRAFT_144167 [Neurospora crassa]